MPYFLWKIPCAHIAQFWNMYFGNSRSDVFDVTMPRMLYSSWYFISEALKLISKHFHQPMAQKRAEISLSSHREERIHPFKFVGFIATPCIYSFNLYKSYQ